MFSPFSCSSSCLRFLILPLFSFSSFFPFSCTFSLFSYSTSLPLPTTKSASTISSDHHNTFPIHHPPLHDDTQTATTAPSQQPTLTEIFPLSTDYSSQRKISTVNIPTTHSQPKVSVSPSQTVPPAKGVYNHRDGMTLEEAYAEYFGAESSPKPFLSTVASLVDAAAEADAGYLGSDPR